MSESFEMLNTGSQKNCRWQQKKSESIPKNELTLRNRKLPKVGFDAIFAAFETSPVFYKSSKRQFKQWHRAPSSILTAGKKNRTHNNNRKRFAVNKFQLILSTLAWFATSCTAKHLFKEKQRCCTSKRDLFKERLLCDRRKERKIREMKKPTILIMRRALYFCPTMHSYNCWYNSQFKSERLDRVITN